MLTLGQTSYKLQEFKKGLKAKFSFRYPMAHKLLHSRYPELKINFNIQFANCASDYMNFGGCGKAKGQ